MSTEIELSGIRYAIGRMNAFDQFHVARRLSTVVSTVISMMAAKQKGDKDTERKMVADVLQSIGEMADVDANYIIMRCLGCVSRAVGPASGVSNSGWAPMLNAQGQLMYQDLDALGMLELVGKVIEINLVPFFGLLSKLGVLAPISK